MLAPCCNEYYTCRLCHDAVRFDAVLDPRKNPHKMDRHAVRTLKCLVCGEVQPAHQQCSSCGVTFGAYWCPVCNFADNTARGQFHCDGCGICREGGRENFYHCHTCGSCIAISTKETHRCKEDKMKTSCFLCLDDIFTSRDQGVELRCGHCMHSKCYASYTKRSFKW